MAKIYSQLEKAQMENTTADVASLPKGMMTYRTDLNVAKVSDGATMKELVDTSTSQVLTLKELTIPLITESATPANPSAGRRKVYFKADGNFYQLNSAGVERPIGTGGGGGSLEWIENANAPISDIENFFKIYKFLAGEAQKLYAAIRVPASYIAGSPIKLCLSFTQGTHLGTCLFNPWLL